MTREEVFATLNEVFQDVFDDESITVNEETTADDIEDWKWEGAGDLVNGMMASNYRTQIRRLAHKKIHLAFVPMDPRLGEHQFAGIDYFMRHTDADYVFPMHMWKDYSGIKEYKKRISNERMAERIVEIACENQIFEIREE